MSLENYSNYIFKHEFQTVKITTFDNILTSPRVISYGYAHNLPKQRMILVPNFY
jgi:hypothetical protein